MKKFKRLMIILSIMFFIAGIVIAEQSTKININTATVKQLSELKGIGPKLAQRIVDFREQNGPFKKIEDILKVKGIGKKKFESIELLITVED